MYWILFVMGAIVAVICALLVGGLLTPRKHVASRSITLRAAPDLVWSAVHDVARYGEWRHEIEDSSVVDAEQPQLRWREISTRGSVTFGVTVDEPPHRFAARILDDDLPYSGEWTWQVDAELHGTRVTITERGEIGNPVFRFIGAHLTGYTRSIDTYLNGLARHVGDERASIVEAAAV